MSGIEVEREDDSDSLVNQLGTSQRKLLGGDVDMRLLTIIRQPEDIPTSLRSRVFVKTRVNVIDEDKPFWSSLSDNLDCYSVAVEGRGRNDMIRGEQVKRGIAVSVASEISNYSFLEKHLTKRREYKEQEEREKLGIG